MHIVGAACHACMSTCTIMHVHTHTTMIHACAHTYDNDGRQACWLGICARECTDCNIITAAAQILHNCWPPHSCVSLPGAAATPQLPLPWQAAHTAELALLPQQQVEQPLRHRPGLQGPSPAAAVTAGALLLPSGWQTRPLLPLGSG